MKTAICIAQAADLAAEYAPTNWVQMERILVSTLVGD